MHQFYKAVSNEEITQQLVSYIENGELDCFEEAMETMAFDNMCRPREERDPFMSDTLDMMGITSEDDDF